MSAAPYAVIVGLGQTGLSCARYLHARGWRLAVTDTRSAPPQLAALTALGGEIELRLGALDTSLLTGAVLVVASPGVPLAQPFFAAARAQGLEVVGDVELFARDATAPVAGITGTNGKSTVTTLLGAMAARAGLRVQVGGNLGAPALDLLRADAELYVLELSSYQLESTATLRCRAATVLNVSPDHLDRHPDLESYAAAKARIFARCDTAVINLDDPLVAGMAPASRPALSFSLRASIGADYALAERGGEWWLTRRESALLPLTHLRLQGRHNVANALAALALGEALGLPQPAMLEELRSFAGLPHRTQWVAEVRGVTYIDDSKGTNVGATLAAMAGLPGPLLLILGGEGKNQDFTALRTAVRGKVRLALLIGRDAPLIEQALRGACPLERAASLPAAVQAAARVAAAGDTVLLSPACASFDMFTDYAQRGQVFAAAVQELAA
ncbi:MAG: UDP-N-acetylmuramoyl-L-alanine--D-glutamate ligase [Gammaproteobacteria bacterium]|nr:UDP-N-acetylmuramoyl-L-alanine--D-glutamate ligase [Gammaproteobacteria bacterium]